MHARFYPVDRRFILLHDSCSQYYVVSNMLENF